MKFRYDKNIEELIVSESTRIEYHQLELWLTRYVKDFKYKPQYKMGIWNGKDSFFKNGKIALGLWKECLRACQEIGSKFDIENKEDFPINRDIDIDEFKEFCNMFFKEHEHLVDGKWEKFIPYDHQVNTVYKILKNRFCVAEVATSGGKSLIISMIIFWTLKRINPEAKFLIIVPSINLVTQFYDSIVEFNFGAKKLFDKTTDIPGLEDDKPCNVIIEEIMSEKPRKYGQTDPNIFIGTYQSLEKWPKDFFKQFDTVICDEGHTAKAKTIRKILKSTFTHARSRIGLSGTFPPDDSCEILTIQSVIGPKITEVTADELKKKGIITPMEIRSIILNHNNPEMLERIKIIRKSGNGKGALDVEKLLIHESPKRMEFIKKLVGKCNNNTLLLFYTIEYGQKLFKELSEAFPDKEFFYIDGTINNKQRNHIKKQMEKTDGANKILIASFGTLAVGISIRAIFNIIFADSFKSEQVIIQSIGRGLRLHHEKDKVIIFDLIDVFSATDFNNILYKQYTERLGFYNKRKYPYKEILINL